MLRPTSNNRHEQSAVEVKIRSALLAQQTRPPFNLLLLRKTIRLTIVWPNQIYEKQPPQPFPPKLPCCFRSRCRSAGCASHEEHRIRGPRARRNHAANFAREWREEISDRTGTLFRADRTRPRSSEH